MLQKIDLAFVVDCTGSMASYIQKVQEHVISISNTIAKQGNWDLCFALVCYRDHPPQDKSFVTRVFDFTPSLKVMQEYVREMKADGGGDAPEAVVDGLAELKNLNWRKDGTDIAVWIGDAPPHGVEGDYNCPCGLDPLQVIREIAGQGICLYAVGCGLVPNSMTEGFYAAAATITDGRYLPLSDAMLLPDLITGVTFGHFMSDQFLSLITSKSPGKDRNTGSNLFDRLGEVASSAHVTAFLNAGSVAEAHGKITTEQQPRQARKKGKSIGTPEVELTEDKVKTILIESQNQIIPKGTDIKYITYLIEKDVASARGKLPEVLADALRRNLANTRWLLHISTPLDIRDALRGMHKEKHITARVKRIVNRHFYTTNDRRLQLGLLRYSADAFREIFDITHPNPNNWKLSWFQAACYGAEAPQDSLLTAARGLKLASPEETQEIVRKYRIPWHYVRSKDPKSFKTKDVTSALLQTESMRFIVDNPEKLEQLSEQEKAEIRTRILNAAKGKTKMNFIDALVASWRAGDNFRPALQELAQSLLERTYLDEEKLGECWIAGDISGSMALTAPHVGFIATVFAVRIPKVRLFLFNVTLQEQIPPKNIAECTTFCNALRAYGGTDIGLIYDHILEERHLPRTLVLITDGVDSQPARFAEKYAKFLEFVSQQKQQVRILYLFLGKGQNIDRTGNELVRVLERSLTTKYAENLDEFLAEIAYGEPETSFWDKFNSVSSAFAPRMVEAECSICGKPLETGAGVTTLACSHKYHTECLTNYWDLIGKKQCVCHCKQTFNCETCGAPIDPGTKICGFCKTKIHSN